MQVQGKREIPEKTRRPAASEIVALLDAVKIATRASQRTRTTAVEAEENIRRAARYVENNCWRGWPALSCGVFTLRRRGGIKTLGMCSQESGQITSICIQKFLAVAVVGSIPTSSLYRCTDLRHTLIQSLNVPHDLVCGNYHVRSASRLTIFCLHNPSSPDGAQHSGNCQQGCCRKGRRLIFPSRHHGKGGGEGAVVGVVTAAPSKLIIGAFIPAISRIVCVGACRPAGIMMRPRLPPGAAPGLSHEEPGMTLLISLEQVGEGIQAGWRISGVTEDCLLPHGGVGEARVECDLRPQTSLVAARPPLPRWCPPPSLLNVSNIYRHREQTLKAVHDGNEP
ncbi:hypothetical protein PR048_025184 [Dryococelus australis]|uniref:Uncharacterized protein n=1 Tax=Dryococelus australis TaxID=614101 RepID=A0ABQ9GQN8_9NEOP|nr:hypothetical protein PR048_025184 [Dryococelus australis]